MWGIQDMAGDPLHAVQQAIWHELQQRLPTILQVRGCMSKPLKDVRGTGTQL